MIVQRRRNLLIVGSLVILGLSGSGSAHGFGPRGPGRDGGIGPMRGMRPGAGLIERLVFPCPAECMGTGRTCAETTDATAVACAEQACTTAIATAQSTCSADRESTECQSARSALRECVQPCVTAQRSAHATCRSALRECLDACQATE